MRTLSADDMAENGVEGRHVKPDLPTCLAGAESMDLHNDPRFNHPTALDRRLKAFHSLTVVCAVMFGTSVAQVFTSKKNMNFATFTGWIHMTSFALMTLVMYMDLFSLFVLVHQLFYCYRLMTSGPSGFEIAGTFYLNPAIAQYRKLAVLGLLTSMPIFLFGCGLHISFLFWRDAVLPHVPAEGSAVALNAQVHIAFAALNFGVWVLMALSLLIVHRKHFQIFRERYAIVKATEEPLLRHIRMLGGTSLHGGSGASTRIYQ